VINGWLRYIAIYDFRPSDSALQTLSLIPGISLFGEGDSITNPPDGSNSYLELTAQQITSIDTFNLAVPGSTVADMVGRQSALISAIGASGLNTKVVVTLIGANGIPSDLSDLTPYWDAIRTAGAKLIVCTMTDQSGTETARAAYNTLIRGASAHYDALCDFAANTTMGASGASANATYFSDTSPGHPTAAGQAILASILEPVVASFQ
jgi:lysophospholipase L1-like esterase